MTTRPLVALLALAGLAASRLAAQCPDGTPPPCAAERRAAARRAPPAAEVRTRRLMLLPFRNVTRAEPQAWIEAGAPLMLAEVLGQFRELTVVPDERLLAARRRLGISVDQPPDADQLRRLAEETQGWTAITGTVLATGGHLRLGAQAMDVATGTVLLRADTEIAGDADVRHGFETLALRLLEVAGVPPRAMDVSPSSTRSLDAYKAYVRGTELLRQSAFQRARDALREAVRLDSTFAMAWARLALAGTAWNLAEALNPASPSYQAVEHAAALAPRLPPREAARVRVLAAFFHARFSAARTLTDSLLGSDPEDLDALEFSALFEMFDPLLDTTVTPATMRGSLNRAVARAREVLERDPGRRYVYAVFGYAYGMAGGLWTGDLEGHRREGPSFAAMLLAPADEYFIPVLRDSFELMPRAAFAALPETERMTLRRRAADAGMQWMQRWLSAGPQDADAHLWTSRLADLQGQAALALAQNDTALALGVESQMEDMTGRRLMLLVRAGRVGSAAVLADSLAAAGRLRRPFVPALNRGYSYGMTALLLSRRFARAAQAVSAGGASDSLSCPALLPDLGANTITSLPDDLVRALMDTLTRHAGAFAAASPRLRGCLAAFLTVRPPRDAGAARSAVIHLLGVTDSLADAGNQPAAFYVGLAANGLARGAVADRLLGKRWFSDLAHRFSIGEQFTPDSLIVAGDSVVGTWRLTGQRRFRWDDPEIPAAFAFVVLAPVPQGDAQVFILEARHPWHPRVQAAEGDVAALAADLGQRSVRARQPTPDLRNLRGGVDSDGEVLRVVVRGDLATALRNLHAEQARFIATPCANIGGECPHVDLGITYR